MSESTPPAYVARGARDITIQWVGGALFVLGILGVLRRHFDGFVSAPGAAVLGMVGTPLTHLLLLLLGCLSIVALRVPRLAASYLWIVAVGLAVIALGGQLAGGADADGFAVNTRMVVVLLVLAGVAAIVALVERVRRRVS